MKRIAFLSLLLAVPAIAFGGDEVVPTAFTNADADIRANDTQEFYGTLSYDILLAPTFAFYYDLVTLTVPGMQTSPLATPS
jgi:hypothetical protein